MQGGIWHLHVQAYSFLGNVMSLVGGFASISCSLLMPSLFYLILFWKELSKPRKAGTLMALHSCLMSGYKHCQTRA